MKTILLNCVFFLLAVSGCSQPESRELRVMSFNIWIGGGQSVSETARVIQESGADVIGVQESSRDNVNIAVHIADSLGWYSYATEGSPAILSRYAITDTSSFGHGVKIQVDKKQSVWMFNIHLMYCPYEPYQLNGIEYCGAPLLNTAEEAIASARNTRGQQVDEIIRDILEAQKEGLPLFLTGDFNEPSCLDWTQKAAQAGLCRMAVAWPSTTAFMQQAGMQDSYRTLYPDETTHPGHTWTSLPQEPDAREVMDRIDFVLYRGNARPTASNIIGEKSHFSDIPFEHYPSDHRAVITTFTLSK